MADAAGTSSANRRPPYGDRVVTTTDSHRLRRFVVPPRLPQPISPAQIQHAEQRAADVQNRVADAITRFAGSMTFVYLHVIWFGCWIGFGVEKYPYGLLTMIVSLEAIFLSTFVMISQNREAKRADIRSQLDFETNLRSEIWSVHIGQALGIDANHVEAVVRRAIEGSHAQLAGASSPSARQ